MDLFQDTSTLIQEIQTTHKPSKSLTLAQLTRVSHNRPHTN